MSKLVQRKGRSGWYLTVALPRDLRKQGGAGNIYKKAGNTYTEALQNKGTLEQEIRNAFAVQQGKADLVVQTQQTFQSSDLSKLSKAEKTEAVEIALQSGGMEWGSPEHEVLDAALAGRQTWMEWIERRVLQEGTRRSTVTTWKTALSQLAAWAKTDRLQGLTKAQAVAYKETLLSRVSPPTTRKTLSNLGGFWNWAKAHGQLQDNVWEGLTRKLQTSKKTAIAEEALVEAGVASAIQSGDWRFLIMKFTGCRKGEASGLRNCDISLNNRTITFSEWEQDGMVRLLKGSDGKDERTVPISSGLLAALQGMDLDNSKEPLWPKSFKSKDNSWGALWSSEFKRRYGFTSHDLRRRAVTRLAVAGVSPFIIHSVTKQAVPGLSEVIAQYTRPTTEELRAAMELL